jgi:predicted Zn-dependent protease
MSLSKFESMLKTNNVYFFDSVEFEEIIHYYLDNGKHSLANKAVKLGLEQHPSSVILKLLKVELLIFEDKLQKALSLIRELEVIEPNNEDLLIQKATISSKNNKHLEAIHIFKQVLPNTEDKIDIWSMIGMEYLYLDDFKTLKFHQLCSRKY